jgi:hypothetical protein
MQTFNDLVEEIIRYDNIPKERAVRIARTDWRDRKLREIERTTEAYSNKVLWNSDPCVQNHALLLYTIAHFETSTDDSFLFRARITYEKLVHKVPRTYQGDGGMSVEELEAAIRAAKAPFDGAAGSS